jgi:uncharacterized protein with HEPN domain
MSARFSEARRAGKRVSDMLQAIADMRDLLKGRAAASILRKTHIRAAFERYLEIVSEASRHVPDDWKAQHGPQIDWRGIQDIGNRLRHGYDGLDHALLWSIYENELDALEHALDAMTAAHPTGRP